MGVNKVKYGENVVLDISSDTVTADKLLQGYTAHDNTGTLITGTATQGGSVTQDQDGFIVLPPDGSGGSGDDAALRKAIVDKSLTTFSIPNTVTNIGTYVFYYYGDLETVTFEPGSALTTIGQYAFYYCRLLDIESLPSTVTDIQTYAFYYCQNLSLSSLPDGISILYDYTFYNCKKLALTKLPNNLQRMRGYVFSGCSELAISSLPNGFLELGSNCFSNCPKVSISVIPTGVVSIPSSCFNGCTGMTTISSEAVLTSIASGSFYKTSITSAMFPNANVSSFTTAFGSTTAANACQTLQVIDIGTSSAIAASAFANCYSLEKVILRKTGSVCTLSNVSAFLNTPLRGYNSKTGTVYVPSALISTYRTATNWSTLYNNGTVNFVAIEGSEYEL